MQSFSTIHDTCFASGINWDANQNLFFEFYISPVIWQKYKIKKNCNNTLLSGKYPVGEIFVGKKSYRETAPSWKCPLGEYPSKKCQPKSALSAPVKKLLYILQSINFNNTLGNFGRKYAFNNCFSLHRVLYERSWSLEFQ